MSSEPSAVEDLAEASDSAPSARLREINDIGVTVVEVDPSREIGAGILGPGSMRVR